MNEPVIRFLDSELSPRLICDDFISLEYVEEFCGPGEFRCLLPASGNAPEPDGFASVGGRLYVIDGVSRDTFTGKIAVSGRGILSLIGRRVVPIGFTIRRGVAKTACRLISTYCATAFPAPIEVAEPPAETSMDLVVEAGDVLERVRTLLSSVAQGIDVSYDDARNVFTVSVIDSVDRRMYNYNGNEVAYLSEGFGTLSGVCEIIDKSNYINRVTVRGSMASDGTVYTVSVNASDYSFLDGVDDSAEKLREGYVKSGIGVTLFTSDDGNGNRVFDREAYFAALRERGRQELARRRILHTLEATLTGERPDFPGVGDLCTLASPVTNAQVVRVAKKKHTVDDDRNETCVARLDVLGGF